MAKQDKRLVLRRVLGAALVISAAVLVFPRLFDGSGVVPLSQRASIPSVPQISVPQPSVEYLDKADALALVAESTPVVEPVAESSSGLDSSTQAERQEVEAPVLDTSVVDTSVVEERPTESGWVVQLGTFSEAANAQRLVDQVREYGEVAFVRDLLMRDERVFYQVMVGPVAQESAARQLKTQLDQQFSLSGLVLQFTP